MGRYINPDEPMSDEDKEFLRGRARGDEVIENERRFPPDADPAPHEAAGFMPSKPGYDYHTQADKIEDAGGLEVQRIPTDDQGRPMVAEYGYADVIAKVDDLESDEPESEDEGDGIDDDSDGDSGDEEGIDDDILNRVMDLTVEELKDELEALDEKKSGNKDELVERLANRLQDDRDKANEATA